MEKTHLDICNEIYKPGMRIRTPSGRLGVIDNAPFIFGTEGEDNHVYANNGKFTLYSPFDARFAAIIKTPEEFDMNTREGRLAYAKKHYPIGTIIKSIHSDKVFKLIEEPRNYMKTTIVAESSNGCANIYHGGKWAEIIKEEEMETQRLSRQGLKEIHSVACSNWKVVLERYGANSPLEDYIELTQEQVNNMFKACTKEQLPIVSKYLKQDDGSVDVTKFKGAIIDDIGTNIISNRYYGIYRDKSFWLNDRFNWEIKIDSDGKTCLIPTKKK